MEDEERSSGCVRGAFRNLNKAESRVGQVGKEGHWDTAKLAVENAGDVTTEEEKSDCYYASDYPD